ncbi:hypothetical protein, partial [Mycolicibacterium llatzerense]|uniref:hypothetical protein n=1 Tax=Mycolicibacterium llatzerense TaxID=280871 RepID=UPI001F1DB154
PIQRQVNSNQKNPITNKRHQTNWHQKNNHTPQTGKQEVQSKNNKQKPPNTLLSSQTTRRFRATPPTYYLLVGLSSSCSGLFRPRSLLTWNTLAG